MEDLIDQAVSIAVDKMGTICEDREKMDQIYSAILTPFMGYLAERFSWFVRAVQGLMILIVIQTLLILFLVYHVRSGGFH